MAPEWSLRKESLVLFETGVTMSVKAAVSVGWIEKNKLMSYTCSVFGAAEDTISDINEEKKRLILKSSVTLPLNELSE